MAVIVGDGDVYVTGSSLTGPTTSAVTTAKYSRTGVRRWVRTYAADGAQAIRPTAIGYAAGPFVAGWGARPAALLRDSSPATPRPGRRRGSPATRAPA